MVWLEVGVFAVAYVMVRAPVLDWSLGFGRSCFLFRPRVLAGAVFFYQSQGFYPELAFWLV